MKIPYVILLLLCISSLRFEAKGQNVITTIAGDGTTGSSGDGGGATVAKLNLPSGVCVDASGNVYIADQYNNRVRKISASSGKITTIAGTNASGYNGDTILADTAQLYLPSGVFVSKQGHIYIADCYNHRIRKIDGTTGIIYTVAGNGTQGYSGDGGAAINAQLSYPTSVAVDTLGNVYFTDYGNSRIRKVLTTGAITTVAGNGTAGYGGDGGSALSAKLAAPSGICLDNAGSIYIADEGNNRIRKVSALGTITTIAGDGSSSFYGDGGSAITASLNGPQSVFVDASGNIFIADMNNQRIREVNLGGTISTIAGTGVAGYTGEWRPPITAELNSPSGVFVNSAGNIFIADKTNNRIRKIAPSTGLNTIVQNPIPTVYPNPNNGKFTITKNVMAKLPINIYNIDGKLIYSCTMDKMQTGVDISTEPAGTYLLSTGSTMQIISIRK